MSTVPGVNREDLLAEAVKAWRRGAGTYPADADMDGLPAVLDTLEPLIRADERERLARIGYIFVGSAYVDSLADLRAKVEALPSPLEVPGERSRWVLRAEVLALFDEG